MWQADIYNHDHNEREIVQTADICIFGVSRFGEKHSFMNDDNGQRSTGKAGTHWYHVISRVLIRPGIHCLYLFLFGVGAA